MAITRLKRKARKNRLRVKVKAHKIKLEGFTPVIRQVDIEAIKEEFKAAASKAASAKIEKKPAPAKEEAKEVAPKAKETSVEKAPKAKKETTEAPKKKAPAKKKAAPKAKKAE